jgi:outer membrane lipoprotein-sorting protein
MNGKISAVQGDFQMLTTAKRPNMVRREITLPGGQKAITGFDGTVVWMQQGNGPAQELKGPAADTAKNESEFDSIFLDYKAKGTVIELIGKDTVNGRPCYHLRVVRKTGTAQQYYIDAETGLESKITAELGADTGQKGTIETELSDYRTVDGRVVPFKVRQLVNGVQAAQITFDTVEFNVSVDDAIFRMPSAK